LFYGVKQKKHNHGFPEVFLTKMVFLFWFSKGFPNKNGIFVLVFQRKTFLFTPFRRDTRKGAGKGYQVRKLPLFTPFRRDTRKGAGKGYQVRKLTKTVS